jgi:hypothetical protein
MKMLRHTECMTTWIQDLPPGKSTACEQLGTEKGASDECFDDLRNNNGFGRNLTTIVSDEQCQTSEE